ncbi:MAG: ectoine/hydroxyectoine ABC transporter substrate-binding protein EhuB, partial [Chloroflexia bacterium]|nr:ectoine/hydroxyectoine ABC transporter substrate-binding protein EhuB [Chloroflexia bacterium]
KIRIGYAVEAPFAYAHAGGQVTGESPDLARYVVAELGIDSIQWVQTDFNALITDLERGRFDVIAAGMFITPERATRVAFSEPTFHVQQALLVAQGNPKQLTSYQQAVAHPDAVIAVLSGSVEATLLAAMALPSKRTLAVPDARTGLMAVETGLADGLALSASTLRWIRASGQFQTTEIAEPFEPPDATLTRGLGYGAFGFRRGDEQLRRAWNDVLKELIGTSEHLRLIAPFGFGVEELPGSITTAEVLRQ